ncbi:MAG: ArnT family glycosyltransferase [Anaerolineae bacterium]
MSKRSYYALAVVILLISAGLRIWNLPTLPIGFSDVELSHIDVMRDSIQRGDIRVFYERYLHTDTSAVVGQEGLYHMVLSVSAVLFGTGTLGLRVLSVLLGMVTLASIYTLGVRLFSYKVGLIAMGFYGILLFPTLLSRLVIVETALPLMVTAILLSLARALPVYHRTRVESSNTVDYAVMGVLIGTSLYLHQSSLFIVLMAMGFITYILLTRRPSILRRLSYIGFAILMLIIIAMPYLLSTFRLPELAAGGRILGVYEGITTSIVDSTLGLMWRGDAQAQHNVPDRPLFDLVSGLLMLIGVVLCVQNWRKPSYALLLIAVLFLGLPAILADSSPNFIGMSIVMPVVMLLLALGAGTLIEQLPYQRVTVAIILLIWAGNAGMTIDGLFNQWANSEDVQTIYNGEIGRIAHHLDQTADDIPTVICNPRWDQPRSRHEPSSDVELILLHMNHDSALLREVDCQQAFLFINAGRHQQVVIVEPMNAGNLYPSVADWLSLGTPVAGLPEDSVIELRVQDELENALGVFITTSPATYATIADVSTRVPVAPPIRFGGNVTWLGYETDPSPEYRAGDTVSVVTYWRIEGLVPSDLLIFTHLLSDPLYPSAQIDTIHIDPTQLRERDVYLHNANIQLDNTVESGDYTTSVGIYQESSQERLEVFVTESATQGNRIFLYGINVRVPESLDN